MVDRQDPETSFPVAHGQKPDCLVVGSLGLGEASAVADLRHYADLAGVAGCHAIRVPYCRSGSFLAASTAESEHRGGRMAEPVHIPNSGELGPSDIEECAQRRLGCLAVAVAVYDLPSLEDIARLDSIAMLAVPAPAATDPRLVVHVAETGLPALMEVNLLSAAAIEDASRRFKSGQLTLMWNQISPRSSPLETVEDLFTLIRLRKYGRPVGYAGVSCDALAIAIGFGAVVLDVPLGGTGSAACDAASFRNLLARLQRAREDTNGELLRTSDLDRMDDLRPSLVATRWIRRGETLTAEMVACKVPFRGLSPSLLPLVLGRRVLYDIARDEPITFGVIDP